MRKKINFEQLKKVAGLHQEDAMVVSYLSQLCSFIFESFDSDEVLCFSEFLNALKVNDKCTEPEISEEAITEKDITEALKDLSVKDPFQVLNGCKEIVYKNKVTVERNYILSNEEAAIVTSYTCEDKINETSPYRIINEKLREGKAQDQITNKKSYFCLLLRALRKLPRTKPQTLYRGIRWDKREYKVGEEIEWQGFTSTSTSMKATQKFLTNSETKKVEGTLFEIRNTWGYDVHNFSDYTDEEGKPTKRKQTLKLFDRIMLIRNSHGAYDEVQS